MSDDVSHSGRQEHPVRSKSARTFVVEPSDVRRSMFVSGLRKLGYTNLTGMKSLSDALALIESTGDACDWLITPLVAEDPVNALAFLALCLKEPSLRSCRVSLVFDAEEADLVANAFELGLFSCHRKSRDVGTLLQSFVELDEVVTRYVGDDTLTAAHFLRAFLMKEERVSDLLRLETTLISLYPGNARIAIKVAEALYLNDHGQPALTALARLKGLSGELAAEAKRVSDAIMTSAGFDPDAATQFAALNGLKTCVIIDPDEAAQNLVEEALRSLGVPEIKCFADGEAAWRFLRSSIEPDLIVQEWRIPKLSGAALVQRVRAKGMQRVPVVVFSSLVKETVDRMLLKELGVTDVLEKPLPIKQLAAILGGIVREQARPRQTSGAVAKIRQHLRARDFAAARELMLEMPAVGPVPPGLRRQLDAELAYAEGRLEDASELAIEALQLVGEDLMLLNLLGKVYMGLRRFEQAQAFFSRAAELSPQNVERLCAMAEVQVEAGRVDAAEDTLQRAQGLDRGNAWVQETNVKVALAKGDTEGAREAMLGVESVNGVIAFMNNRAVALALQNRLDDAVALYHSALASMPASMADVKAVVGYNLALSLVKSNDLKGAHRAMLGLPKVRSGGVQAKIAALSAKVKTSVKSGVSITLNTGAAEGTKNEARDEEVMADTVRALPVASGAEPGQLRCHLVFHALKPPTEAVLLMVGALPRFGARQPPGRGKRAKTNKSA